MSPLKVIKNLAVSLVGLTLSSQLFASNPLSLSDPYFDLQWYLHNTGSSSPPLPIDIDKLHTYWQKGTTGVDIGWLEAQKTVSEKSLSPVLVAVIDSGVDLNHPDLVGRVSSAGCDFLLHPDGCSMAKGENSISDDVGHGTHVSGIIVANSNNGIGISGIAPSSVSVLPLRILGKDFTRFTYKNKLISDYAATAVRYAVAQGARVINMSLGWPSLADTANARAAIKEAVDAGVLVVVAAGNNRKDQPSYPCGYPGVVCVGALSNNGELSRYSNSGGRVDCLAPGDGVVSTFPKQLISRNLEYPGYEVLTGTSQAAPQITGIAAVLLSVNHSMSLGELKARIFSSSRPLPSPGAALYGMPDLNKALMSLPTSVYQPDFKSLDEVSVDDRTLIARGHVPIQVLWQNAKDVRVDATVQGIPAGSARADLVLAGKSIDIKWTYQFHSLDEVSSLELVLKVTDSSGQLRSFSIRLPAARAVATITSQKILTIPSSPSGAPLSWIGTVNGHHYSTLNTVDVYGSHGGLPRYYRKLGSDLTGIQIEIFDPTNPQPIQTVSVPGIDTVTQVLRIDLNRDGKMDWVILGSKSGLGFFQFYFLDPDLHPLWGAGSVWQYPRDSFSSQVQRNYATPGSWVLGPEGKLLPCFLGSGTLPSQDNFDAFDARHYQSDNHFYYLAPGPESKVANGPSGPTQLKIRALDGASYRENAPHFHLHSLVPPAQEEMRVGHVRLLTVLGEEINAPTQVWDIRALSDFSFVKAPGWDSYSSSRNAISAQPTGSSAFLIFFDAERGGLVWSTSQGQWAGYSPFTFQGLSNVISNLVGVFDFGTGGKFWFLETSFDLAAYFQPSDSKEPVVLKTIPIERDSSFPQEPFSELFTPVIVGTSDHPQMPGVYIDSTLVQGNQVSVAVMSPDGQEFQKPLRFSLFIPENCVQMSPIQLTSETGSFGLPLFCEENGQVYFKVIQPGI